jgi:hypothetical protein
MVDPIIHKTTDLVSLRLFQANLGRYVPLVTNKLTHRRRLDYNEKYRRTFRLPRTYRCARL